MLIEPVPELAARCRAFRKSAIVENYALGDFAQEGQTLQMNFCNLMSFVEGGFKTQEEAQRHLSDGAKVQNLESYKFEAKCVSLQSLIDKHNINKIDFLSLDVEGYEAQVLKGIDFHRTRPRFILVEARYESDVRAALPTEYKEAARLSHHDILYSDQTQH